MIGNPRPQDVLEDYFDVSLNPESSGENKTQHDLALFFANWMPEAESTRQFNPNDVKAFLDQIEKGQRDVVKVRLVESFLRMMNSADHRLLRIPLHQRKETERG